jgi:glutamyl-tRNA synthetase
VKALPDYKTELFVHKKMKTDESVARTVLERALPALTALGEWDERLIHDALFSLVKELSMKNGQVLFPVRIALCGKRVTPGGAVEAALLLGRKESLERLRAGLDKLGA